MLKFNITPDVVEQLRLTLGGDAKMALEWIETYKQNAEEQLAEALIEQLGVSIANHQTAQRPINGVGMCTFRIGEKLNNWLHSYCPAFVYDEVFIRQLIADNQHLCLKPGYLRKAQIIRPEFPSADTPKPTPTLLPTAA